MVDRIIHLRHVLGIKGDLCHCGNCSGTKAKLAPDDALTEGRPLAFRESSNAMTVELHGYEYSVYSWIARLALHEKGVVHNWVEINPFADNAPSSYLDLHPFKRVPALVHGEFVLYETNAITRYVA